MTALVIFKMSIDRIVSYKPNMYDYVNEGLRRSKDPMMVYSDNVSKIKETFYPNIILTYNKDGSTNYPDVTGANIDILV